MSRAAGRGRGEGQRPGTPQPNTARFRTVQQPSVMLMDEGLGRVGVKEVLMVGDVWNSIGLCAADGATGEVRAKRQRNGRWLVAEFEFELVADATAVEVHARASRKLPGHCYRTAEHDGCVAAARRAVRQGGIL